MTGEFKIGDKVKFTKEAKNHGFPDGIFKITGKFAPSPEQRYNLSGGWMGIHKEWIEKVDIRKEVA
jgi:hypothetical protein